MKRYKIINLLLIFTITLPVTYHILNAKITNYDERINENIEKYTPLYGFETGVIDFVEIEHPSNGSQTKNQKAPLYFILKLEKPVLAKPEPWAVYGERFIGYTNEDSKIQVYKSSLNPKKSKKNKPDPEKQAIGAPIAITPGDNIQEFKDSSGQSYRITVTIEEDWLPIEIEDSGWISTEYKEARVLKANLEIIPVLKLK